MKYEGSVESLTASAKAEGMPKKSTRAFKFDDSYMVEKDAVHPQADDSKPSSPKERLVYRHGTITTKATNPDSIIDIAVGIVEQAGGHVEERDNTTVGLRVPVAKFTSVFDTLITLGENIDFRKTAEDITDEYSDTESRIRILKRTVKRLAVLVTQAQEEKEKMRLLDEIERLREEIEKLQLRKDVLAKKAALSRITFTVQPRVPGRITDNSPRFEGFEWIRTLDPFATDRRRGGELTLSVPTGMVRLKRSKQWFVESADGSRMWTAQLENNPKGDTKFWLLSIHHRLAADFAKADSQSVGNFQLLRFEPYSGSNYVYYAGISAVEDDIYLVEIYFPDATQEKRHWPAVEASLKEGSDSL